MATLEDELLQVPEVANFLKVPKSRVYFLTHTKQIPVVRLGHRTIRIKKSDLTAWITKRTEEAKNEKHT